MMNRTTRLQVAGPMLGVLVLMAPPAADAASSESDRSSQPTTRELKMRGKPDGLRLHTRRRVEIKGKPHRSRLETRRERVDWDPLKTAVIVVDMWAEHPCKKAMERAAELAPHVNIVIAAARERGVTIVHAPSGGTGFYEAPQYRARVKAAPSVPEPFKIEAWRWLDPNREPPLPIDDRAGGCDDAIPPDMTAKIDRHIHPAITVADGDVVSASGSEIYRLFKHEGIENVVVMGIHTNMCVLGRPFGIRNLVDLGFNVVLARDLTDAMYDPRHKPYVSHEQGTQLVIEHIEEHWCPTILGYDLIR